MMPRRQCHPSKSELLPLTHDAGVTMSPSMPDITSEMYLLAQLVIEQQVRE
jgi:hypothetical protein